MENIFKITKDKERAKSLNKTALERLDLIKLFPKSATFKIVEEYYSTTLELITSIMYSDGFKTLSHTSAIEYLSKNYKEFSLSEIKLIDKMRKLRNGIVYYGEQVNEEFLINYQEDIIKLISKLQKIVAEKIR
jgi:hypothetical protein